MVSLEGGHGRVGKDLNAMSPNYDLTEKFSPQISHEQCWPDSMESSASPEEPCSIV